MTTLYIADFGVSTQLMNGQKSGTITGTQAYMAPEVSSHQPYDAMKADSKFLDLNDPNSLVLWKIAV